MPPISEIVLSPAIPANEERKVLSALASVKTDLSIADGKKKYVYP